jgi:hypothetical protein
MGMALAKDFESKARSELKSLSKKITGDYNALGMFRRVN